MISVVTADNALLVSNLYANLGGMYRVNGKLELAKENMERAIRIIDEYSLAQYHDSIIQITNYVLEDLYDLRNKGAHGDVITKEEYKIISQYKNLGLFDGISIKKLQLLNGKISPTIDEISEYMGLS